MKEVIGRINNRIKRELFFDLSIYKYEKNNLVIAGSTDLTYFHEIEIEFVNVHTVICNADFSVDTSRNMIEIVEDCNELREINLKYGVVKGNNMYKLFSDDGQSFYIISEMINYRENVVKYY